MAARRVDPFLLHLFLYSSLALRDLHSFPTRRSSDLQTFTSLVPKVFPESDGNAAGLESLVEVASSVRHADATAPLSARYHLLDRKSTRLNSSHVRISYAVFCLKIKNVYLYGMTAEIA